MESDIDHIIFTDRNIKPTTFKHNKKCPASEDIGTDRSYGSRAFFHLRAP